MATSDARQHSEWALAALQAHPRAREQLGNVERQVMELLFSLNELCDSSGLSLERLATTAATQARVTRGYR